MLLCHNGNNKYQFQYKEMSFWEILNFQGLNYCSVWQVSPSDPIIGMGTARHSEFKIIYFNASKSQLIFGLEIKNQLQFKCIISYKEGPQPDIECEPVLHMSTYFKTKIPKSGLI